MNELLLQDQSYVTRLLKQMMLGEAKESSLIFEKDVKGFKATTPNGSYIRLKFFDVFIHLKDVRGNQIPGKESSLSYIDVTVMPKGVKGYDFKLDEKRYLWKFAASEAMEKHAAAVVAIKTKAKSIGIDLSVVGSWETHYVGK